MLPRIAITSPSSCAVGLSVPMLFCLSVTAKTNNNAPSQQFVGQRILCNKAKKHFHFYPSRDARTVTVYAFVKTSTADLSPLIVSRP